MTTLSATSAATSPSSTAAEPIARERDADDPQAVQRRGKNMVVAGWIVTVVAAILYCVACFSGSVDADLAEILSTNAVPFARAMLVATGVGTLLWLVGSFVYLRGAMDADPRYDQSEDKSDDAAR